MDHSQSAHQPASPGDYGTNPQFVFHVVRRWWKVVASLGIILAAAAAAIVFLTFKPVYRAVGQIRIFESQPHIAFPAQRGGESRRFVATQLQLMRQPIVLHEVAYDPEVATHPEIREEPDPVDYLQREINVNVIGESEICQIEYRASDPNHAKQVVDKLIASYIRYVDKHDAKLRMSLDTEMERRIRATEMPQDEVRALSEEPGVPLSQPGAVSEVRSLLVQAEVDMIMLKAAIEFQKVEAARRQPAQTELSEEALRERNAYLEKLEWQLKVAEATRETLARKLESLERDSTGRVGPQLDLFFPIHELYSPYREPYARRLAQDIYQTLAQQKIRLTTEENAPRRVHSLNGGEGVPLPRQPVESIPLKTMLIAAMVALMAPFAAALLALTLAYLGRLFPRARQMDVCDSVQQRAADVS